MAALALVLAASGLTFSQSGGILRLAPYATLVLAPLVAGLAVLRPWAGLVTWVVLMPVLNVARVAVLIGDVQLILPTVIIAALALGLWRRNRTRRSGAGAAVRCPVDRVVYAGVGLVVLLTILAVAFGTAPDARSIPIALHGLIEPAVLLAIGVALRPSWLEAAVLVIGMGTSVALATIFNLVRIVVVRDLLTTTDEMRIQLARLTFYNVGIYGDMLTMAIPLLIGATLMRKALRLSRGGTAVLLVGVVISLVGLYLTLSKSGWLGTAVASMTLVFFLASTWRARIVTVAAAAVLIAAVIPYPAYFLRFVSPDLASAYEQATSAINSRSSTIDPSTPEGEVSVTERVLATEGALQMSLDHPLLGVGPGGFAAQYTLHYRPTSSTRALDSAHDLLPYVAAEFGIIVAVLVALGLLGGILLALRASRRVDPEDRLAQIVPLAVSSALVGFVVVSATFGVDLYRAYRMVNSDVLFAALLIALAAACWRLTSDRPAIPPDAAEEVGLGSRR